MAIYLDNNATTPLAPEVVSAIRQACEEAWANPSSGYKRGREAKSILEAARIHMAALVDQEPDLAGDVITFTSGGTEVRCNYDDTVTCTLESLINVLHAYLFLRVFFLPTYPY